MTTRKKRIESRLSAWWSAWKYVAILGLLLVLSVGWNLHQWKNAGVVKERARADAYAETLKTTAGIARDAQKDNTELLNDLAAIAERGQKTRNVYRDAAPTPMAANCAPGKERMDAVNHGVAQPPLPPGANP